MQRDRTVIVGAGIGGLSAAIDLARQGCRVTVVEKAAHAGGKLRQIGGVDSGPTVFTMRWVFDALFDDAGSSLSDHLTVRPAETLARHSWQDGSTFDLFADPKRAEAAVGDFAGAEEARRFQAFRRRARRIYELLETPFMTAQKPNVAEIALRVGLHRPADQWAIMPYRSMWSELGRYFHDPRLRQLFGRYATYCGASPFKAPATTMLIAHVEQQGVWLVEGGMQRIPEALAALATSLGVVVRYGETCEAVTTGGGRATGISLASGEWLEADAVVLNADPGAVTAGRFGDAISGAVRRSTREARSLSAYTVSMTAEVEGPALLRHNVFFSSDYPREFRDLAAGRVPDEPTVYLCAQDREEAADGVPAGPERLLAIVNAPADGDVYVHSPEEIARCQDRTFGLLSRCGLTVRPSPEAMTVTTPTDFEALFPATGGALYGRVGHGWDGAFRRPGARTKIPGLYMAGGATHPGAGVPMAALSGRLAARALMADRGST